MEPEKLQALQARYHNYTPTQLQDLNKLHHQLANAYHRNGTPVFKRWVCLFKNSRHSHEEADGQYRVLEDPFQVGGYPADFPGDPNLPPQLRINCQCLVQFEDEDGQDVTKAPYDPERARARVERILASLQPQNHQNPL